MIIPQAILARIAAGEVRLVFRRWNRPAPRPGATLRTSAGILTINAVTVVTPDAIGDADARDAGAADRAALLASLAPQGTLYRMEVALTGPDPRIGLRAAPLDGTGLDSLRTTLERLDRRQPWTARTLQAIRAQPGVPARTLAAQQGMETLPFKRRVRQLKELGLTESLETGYRLSPRGEAWLAITDGAPPDP